MEDRFSSNRLLVFVFKTSVISVILPHPSLGQHDLISWKNGNFSAMRNILVQMKAENTELKCFPAVFSGGRGGAYIYIYI